MKIKNIDLAGVNKYTESFYVLPDGGGEKDIILSNQIIDEKGISVKNFESVGNKIGDVKYEPNTNGLANNLYFEMETVDKDNKIQKYQLELSVTEITNPATRSDVGDTLAQGEKEK